MNFWQTSVRLHHLFGHYWPPRLTHKNIHWRQRFLIGLHELHKTLRCNFTQITRDQIKNQSSLRLLRQYQQLKQIIRDTLPSTRGWIQIVTALSWIQLGRILLEITLYQIMNMWTLLLCIFFRSPSKPICYINLHHQSYRAIFDSRITSNNPIICIFKSSHRFIRVLSNH